MYKLSFLSALSFAVLSIPLQAKTADINVFTDNGELLFEVTRDGGQIILPSRLGFDIDHEDLGSDVVRVSERSAVDGRVTYEIERADGYQYYLDTYSDDDGVALRYRFASTSPLCIYEEKTSFTFPDSTRVWYASGPFQYGWTQFYQDRTVDNVDGQLLAPPATFRLPGGIYASVTEANLKNFHGAVLFGEQDNKVRFGYVENAGHLQTGRLTGMPAYKYSHQVVRNEPWIVRPRKGESEIVSPWRVLMIADDLNGLINNNMIAAVSDTPDPELFPQGKDTEWIKPGRAVFTWLTEDNNRLSVKNHKRYVDGAAELGLQAVVVDDGWEHWAETEPDPAGRTKWDFLKELTDYASAKGVDIWVWRPSSQRWGNGRDIGLLDGDERVAFMKKCSEIGVKGLKIDFFHTENLFTVNFMEDILRDAAKHRLMVVFHGVNKPAGESVTYPNLLAKEAVRGLECVGGEDSWAPGAPWPYHDTVLPFTRWLAGPADYTPLNFRQFCHESVTFAHQLASIYMFTSPMLILAADMDDMLSTPGRQFIEEVPVVWDETRVIPQSEIGKLAAVARRKGSIWYLTVLNGESPYDGNLDMAFLKKGKKYRVTSAVDADGDRRSLHIKTSRHKGNTPLQVSLLSGGGYLAKFEEI